MDHPLFFCCVTCAGSMVRGIKRAPHKPATQKKDTKKKVARKAYTPPEVDAVLQAWWAHDSTPRSLRAFLKDYPAIPRCSFRRWVAQDFHSHSDIPTSGPDTMLTSKAEQELGEWLVEMADHNLSVSTEVLLSKAETLRVLAGGSASTNRKGKPTDTWLSGFLSRWVTLTHTHTHTHTTHTRAHIHTHTRTHAYTRTQARTHARTHARMHHRRR